MSALTPAERARLYRQRQRGGPARTLSDDPLARAKRRLRRGAKVADLDPAEAEALRAYQREQARKRRTA
jgi:hypothetical protein